MWGPAQGPGVASAHMHERRRDRLVEGRLKGDLDGGSQCADAPRKCLEH